MDRLRKQLNIQHPIIQAPMALSDSPALAAAVSNQGGLGSLGAALYSPEQIRAKIKEIRHLTDKPFNINLFAPMDIPKYSEEVIKQSLDSLNAFRKKLGIPLRDSIEMPAHASFEEKLAVLIDEKIPVFSFTFGILPQDVIKNIQSHGITVIGTATTVREAQQLEQAGVNMIVAQGYEAGGHRGTDLRYTDIADALIGTMALVPQVVDAVNVPVIASGGMMDGRGIVAAVALGAAGVQMGTAFLSCAESNIHPEHRRRLLDSRDEDTRLTKAFTGRMARSFKNVLMNEIEKQNLPILEFPIQSILVSDIREEAKKQNNGDYMSLWAGQGSALCQNQTAAELIEKLLDEAQLQLQRLQNFSFVKA